MVLFLNLSLHVTPWNVPKNLISAAWRLLCVLQFIVQFSLPYSAEGTALTRTFHRIENNVGRREWCYKAARFRQAVSLTTTTTITKTET